MKTTSMKHLYRQMQIAMRKEAYAAVMAVIGTRHRMSPDMLLSMNIPEIIIMLEDIGDKNASMSLTSINAYRAWHEFGCQTFSLDEKTVDMLACTAAPNLDELVGLDMDVEEMSVIEAMDWKIPYPCFAIELPYPTLVHNEGQDEFFTCAVAMPFGERVSRTAGWSLLYLTADDVSKGLTSVANSTSAINSLLTNLSVFLSDGGEKARAPKRIGYEKIVKAKMPVNIWNVRTPSQTDVPLGIARPYISSGTVPPKTFRIGSRFMVRGHWRMQPCGEGRKDKRRTWIRPYPKGPEEGEAFSRVYRVKA